MIKLEYILGIRTNGANPFHIFEQLDRFDQESLAWSIKRMDYQFFLKTAYWFAVSHVAKSRAGMRCQVCNGQIKISVHHRTYETHGREHSNMMDLVVLDDNCHGLFHGHKEPQLPKPFHREPRIKLRHNLVIPHESQADKIPDGDVIILTKELIDSCRSNGSFTNAALRALGVYKADMASGWTGRLIGRELTRDQYAKALEGRFTYKSGPLEWTKEMRRKPVDLRQRNANVERFGH